ELRSKRDVLEQLTSSREPGRQLASGSEPTRGGDARVVAVRRVVRNGTLGKGADHGIERRAIVARSVAEVAVLDAGPEAIRADEQHVAGLELVAGRHAHVG